MSGILETIAQHVTPDMVARISGQLGMDPATTQRAIRTALPNVFGAMADHAKSDSGAAEIHAVAQQPATAVDAMASSTASTADMPAPAGGLLDSMMGHRAAAVQDNVAQSSGIDPQQARKLLMYLAPVALAVLSHQRSQQGQTAQTPGGLSSILQSVQQATQGASGTGSGLGGMLGQLLG